MLIRTDTLQPWRGEPLAGVRHPSNIEVLWTAPALAAIGLVFAKPAAIPEGHRRSGPSTYLEDGSEVIPSEPVPPPTPEELDVEKERTLDSHLASLAFRVLFDHENRIRSLEGRPAATPQQFRAALKARL